MTTTWTDVRYGIRLLVRDWQTSTLVILVLAVGIGATSTMFSFTYGAAMRGLPVPDPDRMVHLNRVGPERTGFWWVSIHDFHDWRDRQTSFLGMGAYRRLTVNLSGEAGRPERYEGAMITPGTMDLLGVRPVVGRGFSEADARDGADAVMLMGYDVWQTRFGGDPGVVGSTVRANARPTTVVGILPEGFGFPFREEVWVPLDRDPLRIPRGEQANLGAFARLRPGVRVEDARAEMAAVAAELALEHPETNENVRVQLLPYTQAFSPPQARMLMFTMLGAVFVVLLIACANVALLLLARGMERREEMAVRSALGAGRGRLVAQLLAEASVLSLLGGALGLAMAFAGAGAIDRIIRINNPPSWVYAAVDGHVLAFILAITLGAAVLSALLPAILASNAGLASRLRSRGQGRSPRLLRTLVAGEVAMSAVLLAGTGVMTRSVMELRTRDLPFGVDGVVTGQVALPTASYPDPDDRAAFWQDLARLLDGDARVEAAGVGRTLPMENSPATTFVVRGDEPTGSGDPRRAHLVAADGGYFDVYGVAPSQGRLFRPGGRAADQPVALVNQAFARRYLAERPAVGSHLRLGPSSEAPWHEIVGVVPDLMVSGPDDDEPEGIYTLVGAADLATGKIALRSPSSGVAPALAALRDAVAELDPDLPVFDSAPMARVVQRQTLFYTLLPGLFAAFGLVGLVLALAGLYGVTSFSVVRRRRELGVRIALGATGRRVLRMMLGESMLQVAGGVAVGAVLSVVAAPALSVVLIGVEPVDPALFAVIFLLLAATACGATLVAGRSAAEVDPAEALRTN